MNVSVVDVDDSWLIVCFGDSPNADIEQVSVVDIS